MTMTAREAFERGTDTFNAHDIDGFAAVLADDVVFRAPGGARGRGASPVDERRRNRRLWLALRR